MLLAKVEQIDERLVITPMKYIGWDTLVAAVWIALFAGAQVLAGTHASFYGVSLTLTEANEITSLFTPVFAIVVAIIRTKARYALWQWPGRPFVFERSPRPSGRIALQVRDATYGSLLFRLSFVLPGPTKPDERTILEASVFSFARIFDHNPFAVSRWASYPNDRLPDNATEYELVMLANLIHDYLGLQEPAPCKHSISFPTPTLNTVY